MVEYAELDQIGDLGKCAHIGAVFNIASNKNKEGAE